MPPLEIAIIEGSPPPEALRLRRVVFVEEQGVPPAAESDGHDARCLHLLLREAGQVVGCARLRPLSHGAGDVEGAAPAAAKVERVAVRADARGRGLGRQIMDALEALARARGVAELQLHAQRSAVPFYERLGWTPVGAPFDEAGIEHLAMRKHVPSP